MEIYQYKFKDKLITFDVNTTTFFALDLVSTKWLMFKNKGLSVDEIKKNLKKSHSSKKRAFSKRNMKRLKEMGFFINSNLKFKKVEGEFRSYELKLHPNSRCNLGGGHDSYVKQPYETFHFYKWLILKACGYSISLFFVYL